MNPPFIDEVVLARRGIERPGPWPWSREWAEEHGEPPGVYAPSSEEYRWGHNQHLLAAFRAGSIDFDALIDNWVI